MGTCCSKKASSSPSPATVVAAPPPSKSPNSLHATKTPTAPEEPVIKKEIFVIKQRRSHERERPNSVTISTSTDTKLILTQSLSPSLNLSSDDGVPNKTPSVAVSGGHPVRTSSCTKEEVDAILIQCGRLSRSSSGKAEGSRKYSGSKRSYDFDQDKKTSTDEIVGDEDKDAASVRHYRRTPSRERDEEYKRSGGNRHRSTSTSREEERKRNNNQSGGSRRLSRSPGRRSETTPLSASSVAAALGGDKAKGQPGKMVSVPASTTGAIKRVSVKRATASPRSQSPANAREQPSLSRNSSRKAEHSPYRRNPLSEIDDNCMKSQQDQQINKKPVAVATNYNKVQNTVVETNKPFHFQSQNPNEGNVGKTQKILNEEEEAPSHGDQIAIPQKGAAVSESSKQPQTITRNRSSRRSRDLDFLSNGSVPNSNDDDVNVPTSYASLLLEDIQNFHQKSSSSNPTFSLPPCLTKACSILDAVADLNSSNNSNVSNTLSDERSTHMSNNINTNSSRSVSPFTAHSRKMSCEVVDKDPLVETEVFVYDDLMEPSIHKYITVRRGAAESGEMEQQESSGSNSFVDQQQWLSSSSWEPNSADSTDRWTSSSNTGDDVAADKEEPHRKRGFSEGARKLRSNGNGSTHLASVSGKKKALDGKVGVASNRAPIAAASM